MDKNIFKFLISFVLIILSSIFLISSVRADNGLTLEKIKGCDIQYMGESCIVEMKITNNTGEILDGEAIFGVEYKGEPFDGIGIYPFFSINNSGWINFTDWQDGYIATAKIFVISQGENSAQLKIDTHPALYSGQYNFTFTLKGITETGEEYTAAIIVGGGGGGGLPPGLTIRGESVRTTDIEETSVTIIWTTSYLSTSQVIYSVEGEPHTLDLTDNTGTPPKYGYAHTTPEYDTSPKVTGHSVTITGLSPGTTYYYRCVSHASPPTITREYSFTTLGVKEEIEEVVSEVVPEEKPEEIALGPEIVPLVEMTEIEEGVEAEAEEPVIAPAEEITEEMPAEELEKEEGQKQGLLAAIGGLFEWPSLIYLLILIIIAIVILVYLRLRKRGRK